MEKTKFIYLQKCRIIIARKLKMPPDDVDIISFINCFERGIRFKADDSCNRLILEPKSNEELKAVLSEYGDLILEQMFGNRYPFFGYMEQYEQRYIEDYMKDFYRKDTD